MAVKRGLDYRARDQDGQIRKKNGTTRMRTLAEEAPEFKAFSPDATLTNMRRRYKVESVEELRAIGARKLRAKKPQ